MSRTDWPQADRPSATCSQCYFFLGPIGRARLLGHALLSEEGCRQERPDLSASHVPGLEYMLAANLHPLYAGCPLRMRAAVADVDVVVGILKPADWRCAARDESCIKIHMQSLW